MKGFQALILILLGVASLNVIIQLVGLIYGIKTYMKPDSRIQPFGGICGSKTCNARRIIREKDMPDGLLGNPEYLVVRDEYQPDRFIVEEHYAARKESESFCGFYSDGDFAFYIFTKEDPGGAKIKMHQVKDLLKLSKFQLQRPTMLLIPGWRNDLTWPFAQTVKNAALESKLDLNLVIVDWSIIAKTCYLTAIRYGSYVGSVIADFILKLESQLSYGIHHITVVGHSLGAHVAGFTGAKLNGRLETIVGLDPAGPIFIVKSAINRLDPTDAKYVQVIHTNAGLVYLGTIIVSGHVDFYPNGGDIQAGCSDSPDQICSHNRAFVYYAESLINSNFLGWECNSYLWFNLKWCLKNPTLRMGGFPVEKGQRGKYYLYTNSKAPYAKGDSMEV